MVSFKNQIELTRKSKDKLESLKRLIANLGWDKLNSEISYFQRKLWSFFSKKIHEKNIQIREYLNQKENMLKIWWSIKIFKIKIVSILMNQIMKRKFWSMFFSQSVETEKEMIQEKKQLSLDWSKKRKL